LRCHEVLFRGCRGSTTRCSGGSSSSAPLASATAGAVDVEVAQRSDSIRFDYDAWSAGSHQVRARALDRTGSPIRARTLIGGEPGGHSRSVPRHPVLVWPPPDGRSGPRPARCRDGDPSGFMGVAPRRAGTTRVARPRNRDRRPTATRTRPRSRPGRRGGPGWETRRCGPRNDRDPAGTTCRSQVLRLKSACRPGRRSARRDRPPRNSVRPRHRCRQWRPPGGRGTGAGRCGAPGPATKGSQRACAASTRCTPSRHAFLAWRRNTRRSS
jgi:hypothetical protein